MSEVGGGWLPRFFFTSVTHLSLQTIDCCTSDVADLDFKSEFTLTADTDCTIYALIGYFDTLFSSEGASEKVSGLPAFSCLSKYLSR